MSLWALIIAAVSAVFTVANLVITWNQRAADLRIEHGSERVSPDSSLRFDFWDITAVGNHPLRDVTVQLSNWEAEGPVDRQTLAVMTDGSSVRLYRGGGAVEITATFKRGKIGWKQYRELLSEEPTALTG